MNLSASRGKIRGRHRLTFLVLSYTGGRPGEMTGTEDKMHRGLKDLGDIDFREGEEHLTTLFRIIFEKTPYLKRLFVSAGISRFQVVSYFIKKLIYHIVT